MKFLLSFCLLFWSSSLLAECGEVNTKKLLLSDAFKLLSCNSIDISLSKNAIVEKEQEKKLQIAPNLPQVNFNAGARADYLAPTIDDKIITKPSAGIGFDWTVYDSGVLKSKYKEYDEYVAEKKINLDEVINGLSYMVFAKFIQFKNNTELKNSAQKRFEYFEKLLKKTEYSYKTGIITKSDVLSVKNQMKKVEIELNNIGSENKKIKLELSTILNKNIEDLNLVDLDFFLKKLDVKFKELLVLDREEHWYKSNNDILTISKQISALKANIDGIRNSYGAKIKVSAGYTVSGGFGQDITNQANVGISLNKPLFGKYPLDEKIRLLEMQISDLKIQEQKVITELNNNLLQKLNELDRAKDNYSFAESGLELAMSNYDLLNARYQSRVSTLLELLKAESDLKESETQKLISQNNQLLVKLDFVKHLGAVNDLVGESQ